MNKVTANGCKIIALVRLIIWCKYTCIRAFEFSNSGATYLFYDAFIIGLSDQYMELQLCAAIFSLWLKNISATIAVDALTWLTDFI